MPAKQLHVSAAHRVVDVKHVVTAVVAIAMLTVAVLALRHLLREYHWTEIAEEFRSLTTTQITLSVMLMPVAYFVLTFYDLLGLKHLGRRVAYGRVILVSFTSYAFSHNLGFAPLTAFPLRVRLYAPAGLSALEVAELFAFTSLTFGLGFLAMGGLSFAVEPLRIPQILHLPDVSLHPIGWVLLAALAGYVFACGNVKRTLTIAGHSFRLPGRRIAFLQILVASLDWLFASAVLYALLETHQHVSYLRFVGIFALAFGLGTVSHVPGGLGVFEAVMIFFLSPGIPVDSVVGSLLAFRVVYNLIPFVVALLALGIYATYQHRHPHA